MTAAAKAAPVHATIAYLPLGAIAENPDNPRKTFDEGKLQELAADVAVHGVLQPILVRPVGKTYELVYGHRRFRAAKLAGLTEIPAQVRELGDEQVLEVALVENASREDIPPLEEAEALEQLHVKFGQSVEQLADRTGKSKASIYARLKLTALGPEAREAMREGQLDFSLGLLLARIPNLELQKKALKDVLAGQYGRGEPMSYRQAAEYIQHRYMLQLKSAPFDRGDETLVPSAGACTVCPKRTGAQPELFGDVKSADVCTDPVCYRGKVDAHWDQVRIAAKDAGRKVLNEKETKNAFPYNGDSLAHNAAYVKLDDRCYEDPKQRTYGQLVGKDAASAIARTPAGGIVELVPKAVLPALLKEAGVGQLRAGARNPRLEFEKEKKARERQRRMHAVARHAIARVVEEAEKTLPDSEFWRILLTVYWGADANAEVAKRRGYEGERHASGEWVKKHAKSLDEGGLRALVLELAMSPAVGYSGGLSEALKRSAALYRVDLKKVEAEVAAPKASAKKKPAPARKKKAKARA